MFWFDVIYHFCNYASFCLEFSAVNNNSTITLIAFVFAFKAKPVVCSSACIGIYEKIHFCFSFFDNRGIIKTPFTHLDKGCPNAHPNRITKKIFFFAYFSFGEQTFLLLYCKKRKNACQK